MQLRIGLILCSVLPIILAALALYICSFFDEYEYQNLLISDLQILIPAVFYVFALTIITVVVGTIINSSKQIRSTALFLAMFDMIAIITLWHTAISHLYFISVLSHIFCFLVLPVQYLHSITMLLAADGDKNEKITTTS